MIRGRGFTLVELMFVIAIIGTLSLIVFASLVTAREKARLAAGKGLDSSLKRNIGDDIVGEWLFDFANCASPDTATGAVQDTSANNENGTLTNTVAASTDTPYGVGCSLVFTTASNGYVNVPQNNVHEFGTGDFTASMWIKTTTTGQTAQFAFISKFYSGTGPGWAVVPNGTNSIKFAILNGTEVSANCTNCNYTDGAWHSVVATRQGTTITIYYDGRVGGMTTAAGAAANVSQPAAPLVLGARYNGSGYTFTGQLDDVRLYRRSLVASEVEKLYAEERNSHPIAFER